MLASDYLRLICDDRGEIIINLFYENIRDYIEGNNVNEEIKNTLMFNTNDRFVLINNGITMIARKITQTSDNFTISDFQVVNGCQTSHVLHKNRSLLGTSVRVPFRLISTQYEGVIEDIIKATNRQTNIQEDQFFAMKQFAKDLERYFMTFPVERRLFYERRPHRYDSVDLDRVRIITHQNLIRAVGAMFLGEPHITTGTFRALRAKVGKEIFCDGDKFEPYYVAALALYRLENIFKQKKLQSRYKAARYQILLIIRLLLDKNHLPRMNSGDMAKRCETMMQSLWDECSEDKYFKAAEIIDYVGTPTWTRDSIRTEPVTKAIFTSFGLPFREMT